MFDALPAAITTPDHLAALQDIVDQLNLGDMPPSEEKQPARDEARAVITLLTKQIASARTTLASTGRQTDGAPSLDSSTCATSMDEFPTDIARTSIGTLTSLSG